MVSLDLLLSPVNRTFPTQLVLPMGGFGLRPPFHWADAIQMVAASPRDACAALQQEPLVDTIVLAQRGNCTFLEKAKNAAAGGALALVVINNDTACLDLVADPHNVSRTVAQLAVMSMRQDTGAALLAELESADRVDASVRTIRIHALDAASLALVLLAVTTIVAGSFWSGLDYKSRMPERFTALPQLVTPPSGQETVTLTKSHVVAFVSVATVMMFAMFYLLNQYTFLVILAIFSWGSFVAVSTTCQALIVARFPRLRSRPLGLPFLREVTADWALAVVPAFVLVCTWLVARHAPWAWVLQNVMGINFMILFLRTIQLPSTAVASLLLGLLFFYDIFMVFITPLFMPRGESVMIRVARGGSSHEIMPMLLVMPRFLSPLPGVTMLGYGDVVVPGLLLALLRRVDIALALPVLRGYFAPTVAAYVVGLLLTYTALEFDIGGSQGQPALLYLVPCTLGTALGMSAWRQAFRTLWTGELSDDKDSGSDLELGDDGRDTATSGRRAQQEVDTSDTTSLL